MASEMFTQTFRVLIATTTIAHDMSQLLANLETVAGRGERVTSLSCLFTSNVPWDQHRKKSSAAADHTSQALHLGRDHAKHCMS